MITFNTILADAGLDLGKVKLVRHQDQRHRLTLYDLWTAQDGRFDLYQRIQVKPKFSGATFIASFVTTPVGETLFVGIFDVKGVRTAPAGTHDPLTGQEVGGLYLYDLAPAEHLRDYRGRLFIEWGDGYLAWVQWALQKGNVGKPITEIRRTVHDLPFPGFLEFRHDLRELRSVPLLWRSFLSSVTGVYVLTCLGTGQQYVGAAYGLDGFWGRWVQHARSEHGDAKRLKKTARTDYQVTILEVASSSAKFDDVLALESRWKRKLLTVEYGLNDA